MNNTTLLRKLLDEYYDGTASVEQTDMIRRLFDQITELPADLEADRKLFDALYSSENATAPLPSDVMPAISATIDSLTLEPAAAKRRRSRVLWLSISGVAASIALITLAITYLHSDMGPTATPPEARTIAVTAPVQQALTEEQPEVRQDSSTADDHGSINEAERPKPANTARQASKSRGNTPAAMPGVRVVTDLHEAEAYTLMALGTLSESIGQVRKAGANASSKLDNINRTLNNILK